MIYYKSGFKYQLTRNYVHQLGFELPHDIKHEYFTITKSGLLTAFKGYAWDGPSGPTFDTKNFMRGSLTHDIGFQCIRLELLPPEFKHLFDLELKSICLEDGMSKLRAWWVFKGVSDFASFATKPSSEPVEQVAP